MTFIKFPSLKFHGSNTSFSQYVTRRGGNPQQILPKEEGECIARLERIKREDVVGFEGKLLHSEFSGEKSLSEQMSLPWDAKKLDRLKIGLPGCEEIQQSQINEIAKLIRRHSAGLSQIDLNFSGIITPANVTLGPIFDALKHVSHLEDFRINLARSNFIRDDRALIDIAKPLRYLNELRDLELNLSGVASNERINFNPILDSMRSLKHIERLAFNMNESVFIHDSKTLVSFGKTLRDLPKLNQLEFGMAANSFGEVATNEFIYSLRYLGNLRVLNLSMSHMKVLCGDKGVGYRFLKDLWLNFGELQSLRALGLNFSGNWHFNDDTIVGLCSVIHDLTELKNISLHIRDTEGTTQSIKQLTDSLRDDQRLTVDATDCSNMKHARAREIMQGFESNSKAYAKIDLRNFHYETPAIRAPETGAPSQK